MTSADVTCVGEVLIDFLSSAPTTNLETAKPGGIPAMPSKRQVIEFLRRHL